MTDDGGIHVQPLESTVAVLTGGTSGMGLESAAQLAEAGVPAIIVNGRDAARGAPAPQASDRPSAPIERRPKSISRAISPTSWACSSGKSSTASCSADTATAAW